ncbi:insertion element iS1 1/5/6 protein insB [Flammeovirgaceae bacterium 311]|nr:insertion element iS1 1/5/6 protein insB [Flammeovirgaceae bacterium 311]
MHRQTAIKILEQRVQQLSFKHWQSSYDQVQIDELYSFVESKENKRWLLYAYAPETDEVLARGAQPGSGETEAGKLWNCFISS